MLNGTGVGKRFIDIRQNNGQRNGRLPPCLQFSEMEVLEVPDTHIFLHASFFMSYFLTETLFSRFLTWMTSSRIAHWMLSTSKPSFSPNTQHRCRVLTLNTHPFCHTMSYFRTKHITYLPLRFQENLMFGMDQAFKTINEIILSPPPKKHLGDAR